MNKVDMEYFRSLIFKALFSDVETKDILLLKGGAIIKYLWD